MADFDMTTQASLFNAVSSASESVVTLSPQRTYEIINHSPDAVYGSTDNTVVDADDSSALGKIKLPAAADTRMKTRLSHVKILRLKAASGTRVVQITAVGMA